MNLKVQYFSPSSPTVNNETFPFWLMSRQLFLLPPDVTTFRKVPSLDIKWEVERVKLVQFSTFIKVG